MSFLPLGNLLPSVGEARIEYVQAADPETMERLVAQLLAAIVKENEEREPGEEFNVNDIRLSGGGDGHTFVTRVYLSTVAAGVSWVGSGDPPPLALVAVKFWMASSAEELAKQVPAKLAALRAGIVDLNNIAADDAGASQGTRFMGFLGGERIGPQ
jgi:hypothetical protein